MQSVMSSDICEKNYVISVDVIRVDNDLFCNIGVYHRFRKVTHLEREKSREIFSSATRTPRSRNV